MEKMKFSYGSIPIQTINNRVKKKEINLSPEFQRVAVWKPKFKNELILSILYNYPIGNFIFFENEGVDDIVDGQQRLRTIVDFISGDYNVTTRSIIEKFRTFLVEYKDEYYEIMDIDDREKIDNLVRMNKIKYSDFPGLLKDDFNAYNISITKINNVEYEAVPEYFKLVQNQEKLKAGEIISSFIGKDIKNLLDKIDYLNELNEIFLFNNQRKDLERIIVNFIGVIFEKIPLNCADDLIINFADNFITEENNDIEMFIDRLNILGNSSNKSDKKLLKGEIKKIFIMMLSFEDLNDVNDLYSKINSLSNKNQEELQRLVNKSIQYQEIQEFKRMVNNNA